MLNRPIQFGTKSSSRATCSDGSAAFGLFLFSRMVSSKASPRPCGQKERSILSDKDSLSFPAYIDTLLEPFLV